MKKIFGFAFMIAVLSVFTACNNETTTSADMSSPKESITKMRGMKSSSAMAKKSVAAAYHYNSLASFRAGEIQNNMRLEDLDGNLEDKAVNFVVLYETEAPWAEKFNSGDVSKTGDEKFNELLNSYDLTIVKQFELDESNEGLVLEPNASIDDPVEAARKISMIDYVMMVHLKEVPKDDNQTADNE